MTRLTLLAAASVALGACALKGDVRRVEDEVAELRTEAARADTARAVLLDQILTAQQQFLDSLMVLTRRLTTFQGDVRTDMTDVQRQLVQIQELTGQSQQRLTELRGQLDDRLRPGTVPGRFGADTMRVAAGVEGGSVGAQQLYDVSLQQLRRGAPATARAGFSKLLVDFPDHPLSADAQFFIGESWEGSMPDSAAAAYERVITGYRDSRHAPTALYRLGLLAERSGDRRAAEVYYTRVIAGYPRSEEAQLARAKLNTPGR